MTNRRVFMVQCGLAGTAVLAVDAKSQGVALTETDPLAAGLGYKADASKVDKVKFPKFAAGQQCTSCSVYLGKADAANGPCPIFANKNVAAKGWCSAWVKKA